MNTRTLGFGLIGFGLVLLLTNFYQVQVDLTLLVIGACFMAAYFGNMMGSKKNIGFLIPGCILVALGVWEVVSSILMLNAYDDLGFFISGGTAFLAIYGIGSRHGHGVKWAAIVALCAYAFSAFLFLVNYSTFFATHEDLIFPFVLIVIGTCILVGTTWSKIRKR